MVAQTRLSVTGTNVKEISFQLIVLLYTVWAAIGMILLSVCLSVCLSISLWRSIVALRSVYGGWKSYRHVPRRALPIHFFRHFCCRIYRSATRHSEKLNRRNFPVCSSHGQHGHMTITILHVAHSAVRFCIYSVRRTKYDRPSDIYASCFNMHNIEMQTVKNLFPTVVKWWIVTKSCVLVHWSVVVCMLAVINQERTIHNIGKFDKSKLKHAETEVKNPLPDKEGEIVTEW